jgi:hypothetical protein
MNAAVPLGIDLMIRRNPSFLGTIPLIRPVALIHLKQLAASHLSSHSTTTKPQSIDISAYDFLLANMHDFLPSEGTPDEEPIDVEEPPPTEVSLYTRLINAAKSIANHIPPGDIRRVMPMSTTRKANIAQI